jgi:hypothetical protein
VSDYKSLKTSEGGENDSLAKPLYGLTPVSGFESLPLPQFLQSNQLPSIDAQQTLGSPYILVSPQDFLRCAFSLQKNSGRADTENGSRRVYQGFECNRDFSPVRRLLPSLIRSAMRTRLA